MALFLLPLHINKTKPHHISAAFSGFFSFFISQYLQPLD